MEDDEFDFPSQSEVNLETWGGENDLEFIDDPLENMELELEISRANLRNKMHRVIFLKK